MKYSVIFKKSIKQTKYGKSCSFSYTMQNFLLTLPLLIFLVSFCFPLLLIRLQSWYPLRYTLLVFLNTQIAITLIKIIEFRL